MKRAVVLRIEDSNFAGYGWTWEFSVTRRKDGSFSVTAKQETIEGPATRIPHRHPLCTGEGIWEALEEMVSEAGYAISPGDNEKIIAKIEKIDRRIGRELRSSMRSF